MSEKVRDVLLRKQVQISAAAELAAAETNDWQTIQAHLTRRAADIELTPVQQAKLKRYQFIYNQLSTGKYSEIEVCEMVQELEGVTSMRQALQDIRDAKEIFCTVYSLDKLYEIKVQLEINREMLAAARARGDMRAYANLEKNRAKLIDMIPDDDKALGEEFVPHTNNIVFDPSLLGIEPIKREDLEKLKHDLEERYGGKIAEFEDIPYEEVKDAE